MKWKLFACVALFLCTALRASADSATNSPLASAPKSYQIRNVKYADLLRPEDANNANGTRLVLYPAQPWKCMTWKLLPAGADTFQVRNHFTSKTFAGSSTNDVAPVVQVPFAKDAAARPVWHFIKLNDGGYEITDPKTGRVLTAEKERGSPKITLEPWHDQPEQKWELIEIDPATLTM
ncbi:MAG: RICIN domain-containing protein [Verrucomicrobiae bacterium]|nr:RICIN domain-containing protein [Verrucomicrobiae bacterium]